MKNEKIIIKVKGFLNVEEKKEYVIVSMWFTNWKNNNEVYIGRKMLWKAIGCALYASTEIRDHEFCVPYFEKRKRE